MTMSTMAPSAETPAWLRILLGIILIIAGVVVLGNVMWFSVVGAMIIGIAAIVGGAFEIIHAFWTKGWGGFIWQIILGVLYIIARIFVLSNPVEGVLTLTWVIAVVFIASGLVRLFIGFQTWSVGGWLLVLLRACSGSARASTSSRPCRRPGSG